MSTSSQEAIVVLFVRAARSLSARQDLLYNHPALEYLYRLPRKAAKSTKHRFVMHSLNSRTSCYKYMFVSAGMALCE